MKNPTRSALILIDMERMGAVLMDTAAFEDYDKTTVPDLAAGILADIESES